jgi:hypothetical protein
LHIDCAPSGNFLNSFKADFIHDNVVIFDYELSTAFSLRLDNHPLFKYNLIKNNDNKREQENGHSGVFLRMVF